MSRYSRYQSQLLNPMRRDMPVPFVGTDEPQDDLALVCQKCGATVTQYDAAGNAWCGDRFCAERAQLVNRGYILHYPKVAGKGMGVNAGRTGWVAFALRATEDRIQAVLAVVTSRPEFGRQEQVA